MRAQHTPQEKLFHGHTPELDRRQQRQLPGFYTSSPIQQKNYLSALMGNRENTSTVDRSLGPRTSRVKSPRHTINLDTSSDDFPNLPNHKTKQTKTNPPPSLTTITPDQSELQTINQQLDIITKSHEAIITMQKQLQAQIDSQNKILELLTKQSQQSQTTTHTSTLPPSIENPPTPRESLDMIGLSDFMDDTTPGINKRNSTSPTTPTDADLAIFQKVITALDEKIRLADKDNAQKIRQTKNYMVSYQREATRIYNETFNTSQWTIQSGKKTRASRHVSFKQAGNDSGLANKTS